ncbi:MAG TPA: hypothetical protein VFM10_06440, partial [Terriglobales bacterium]|nr:hypothetical protein [Terriglobales bacterium]
TIRSRSGPASPAADSRRDNGLFFGMDTGNSFQFPDGRFKRKDEWGIWPGESSGSSVRMFVA